MKRKVVVSIVLVVVIIALEVIFKDTETQDPFAGELIALANTERDSRLKEDGCLDAMAVKRAQYLVENDTLKHFSPDGTTPWMFVDDCGGCKMAGENLMKDFKNPADAHRALMASPLHKKNIVNPKFNRIGVGCYEGTCVEFFKWN